MSGRSGVNESIRLVPVGTQGGHALDVRDSSRLWRYYHERYCFTLVTEGHAHWRYRNRYAEASSRGVMLMEPGEVHVNTSVEQAGSFFAVCIEREHLAELTRDHGVTELHFNAQFLRAAPCVEQLRLLKQSCEDDEPAAQEEQLSLALREILTYSSERAMARPSRASTPTRRGAKMLRDRYHAERWRTVDVRRIAEDLGMNYHWFVHCFKREFGLPPYQFVQALRREYARGLMATGPSECIQTMRDIAVAAGYADASHMTRDFRRAYGLTPGDMAPGMNAAWSLRARSAAPRCTPS